ncbi:MAG: hypothetical protein U0169_03830 [Polyangiaceae bacterium]
MERDRARSRISIAKAAVVLLAIVSTTGCSSLRGSAVRTGPMRRPPATGAIALFAPGHVPQGRELGVVVVHATGIDATVDVLTPEFVRKAASLGANAAVVEDIHAEFAFLSRPFVETYAYPCGFWTCTGTRMSTLNDELLTVTLRGRAFLIEDGPVEFPKGAPSPGAPPELAPSDEVFP